MFSTKILSFAALAVVLGALYAAYVAPSWKKKVTTPSVTPPTTAMAVEEVRVTPSPVIEQSQPSPPAMVLIVTGDGQQADPRPNAGVCSEQPLACAP
jgi:hypothetical protein